MMKRLVSAVVLTLFLSIQAQASGNMLVLTSLDVMQAMGQVLTKDTSITVEKVIPKGYSMRGQDAYFKKHQKAFFATAEKADAVLTVGAAWAADPLFKWTRRGNIRVVNIDAAKPLDEYGAGVPLVEVEGEYSPFVWRSPANLTRMASIASDDLCRLSPQDAEAIKANLLRLQGALFKLRSRYEAASLELEFVDLAAMTSGFTYLADEFGLDIHFYMLKPEAQWTDAEAADFSARLRRDDVKAVLCPWEPDAKGAQAIKDGGAVPVVLGRFTLKENADPLEALVGWYDLNLSRLIGVLNTN